MTAIRIYWLYLDFNNRIEMGNVIRAVNTKATIWKKHMCTILGWWLFVTMFSDMLTQMSLIFLFFFCFFLVVRVSNISWNAIKFFLQQKGEFILLFLSFFPFAFHRKNIRRDCVEALIGYVKPHTIYTIASPYHSPRSLNLSTSICCYRFDFLFHFAHISCYSRDSIPSPIAFFINEYSARENF